MIDRIRFFFLMRVPTAYRVLTTDGIGIFKDVKLEGYRSIKGPLNIFINSEINERDK